MAGPNVIYTSGQFTWSYTPPSPNPFPATEFHLKWGTTSGAYPSQKVYPMTSTGAAVKDVLPVTSSGQFYAKLVVANANGEGAGSAEVPFVLSDGLPGGSVTFSVA